MNKIVALNSMPSYCSSFIMPCEVEYIRFGENSCNWRSFILRLICCMVWWMVRAYHVRRMKQSSQDNHILEKHSFERRNSYFLWNIKLLRKLILRSSKWNSSLFYLIRSWDDVIRKYTYLHQKKIKLYIESFEVIHILSVNLEIPWVRLMEW